MPQLMRCLYCGVLQDEPSGAKTCVRCGGELGYVSGPPPDEKRSYLQVQMELDQVVAPAGRTVDRHLLVTLRTPAQVPAGEGAATAAGRPPLNLTAVLDISGSMAGAKLSQAKNAVRQALNRLRDGDTLALVTFNDQVHCVLEPSSVDENLRRVVGSALREIEAGGMTALCGGLELGIEKALAGRRDTNLVLLLSDGQANVGETDLERVGHRAREARQRGLIVSTLGVGDDYNEALMVEIANQGGGRFYHVERPDQIVAYLTGELGEVAVLAARETRIVLDVPGGAIVAPLSAAYAATQDGGRATVTVGDIPLDTELEVPLRVTMPGQRGGGKLSFEGLVTYQSPAGHALKSTLNRVTLRFVEQDAFEPRGGVVVPVVERVLEHMRASSVINMSRAMTLGKRAAARQEQDGLAEVRAYAELLGEERAMREAEDAALGFTAMQAAPSAAKAAVASAFTRQRSTKRFDKDKQDT